jgi:lysophospholipase L1-like esterase
MKPFKILLFFLSVSIVLFALALYFPNKGIRLPGDIRLGFYTADDIFTPPDTAKVDIQFLIKKQELLTDSVISKLVRGKKVHLNSDSLSPDADSLKNIITRIEYPPDDSTVLSPVFRAMSGLPHSNQLVRIMHYGDSQIEGDRMTSVIRNKLQSRFGGSGIGLVPASQQNSYSLSLVQQNSDNWDRYLAYGPTDNRIEHCRFGALASFSRLQSDTLFSETDSRIGWIKFNRAPSAYENTRTFRQCRIFYGNNSEPFINEIFERNQRIDAAIIPPSKGFNVIRWTFNEPVSDLLVQFRYTESPEIYGLALDNTSGIAVDNISLRGCAGLIFTSIDPHLLQQMYKELNVKLFILQFGGNVVPYIADNYRYYEKWYYRQIVRLKELCPGASILVIGIADMSVKNGEKFESYPNLDNVINAIKKAAFKAGAAFWDMQKAMGGKNSMPAWVNADPPLATSDYVHFNKRGSVMMAQMFYNAFIYEYLLFEKNRNMQEITLQKP